MTLDIDRVLRDWDYTPGEVIARRVRARDGRTILQMRLDLGVLQMEPTGRPDGARPHGFSTYYEYLRQLADSRGDDDFRMSEDHCQEADREFLQFYHRRLCWLALKEYDRAVADADHNLAFMDFVKRHSPNEQYTMAHEQYRGYVMYHRTQAAVAVALERGSPEQAVDTIHAALDYLGQFFEEHGLSEQMEEDVLVQRLRDLERTVRKRYRVRATLREQLDRAVANEQYELAARLRDRIRSRDQQ